MSNDIFTAHPLALLVIALLAAVLSFGILAVLLRTGWAWKIAIDVPNQRSLHTRPVPRIGGWGFLPAAALLISLEAPSMRALAGGAVLLGIVSLIDDRRGRPARIRFAAHIAVAAAAVALSAVD